MNNSFTRSRIHDWQLFSFSTSKIMWSFFLVSMVSDETSTVIWIGVPLYRRHCFSLATFKILFYIFSLQGLTVCHGIDFFGFIIFSICSASCICRFVSFTKFGKFFKHYLFEYSFSPQFPFSSPSGTLIIQMLGLSLFPTDPWSDFYLCCSIFSLLFRLIEFYCSVLKFTDSVFSHLHSTIEHIQQVLKFSVIVFFSSMISIFLYI